MFVFHVSVESIFYHVYLQKKIQDSTKCTYSVVFEQVPYRIVEKQAVRGLGMECL